MTEPRQQPGRSRQDYGTPPELLEAVKAELGIKDFTMDLAASAKNRVTDRFYACDAFGDSLSSPWPEEGWNWLNPPYARITPWVRKAFLTSRYGNARTAVLVPAAVGSNWWRDFVHEKCHTLFLNPRITFVGCSAPYPKDCVVLLYSLGYQGYRPWTWKQGKAMDARFTPVDQGTAIGSAEKEQRVGDGGRG